jgi:ribosomal protein S12 methylthiotransferase accessory factor
MKNSFSPVFTTPTVIETNETTFHKFEKEITMDVPGDLVKKLISVCDGTKSLNEIIDLLKDNWEEDYILALFDELHKNNLVSNKLQVTESVWKAVENPSPFPSSITEKEISKLAREAKDKHRSGSPERKYDVDNTYLHTLLNQRRSVRSFSGKSISFQSIVNMLWAAYGETVTSSKRHGRKTVPSAGALYPSLVHIALFQDTEEIKSGVYEVYFGSAEQVGFKLTSEDTDAVVRSFVDPLTPENSHGVVVISGSFRTNGRKYGNRSLLYTILEAGHIAQNVHLAAHDSQVATVEVGGFYEQLLSESLMLSENYQPLTTIVFGEEAENTPDEESPHIETLWKTPFVDQYRLKFNTMLARIDDGTKRNWSSGKAVSSRLAKVKALAEAREWAAYEKAPEGLLQAQLTELENVVHPYQIFKFHENQFEVEGFSFKPFKKIEKYAWVEAAELLQGSKTYVLADHVYSQHPSSTKRCASISSSGVAAHTEQSQAVKNGTLELIERDAFMNAYLGKLSLPTIAQESLPKQIQARINHLKENGFKVWIKDFSLDLAPVVFVLAQSKELTFTTCASCSHFEYEEAVDHALMEVEQSVLSRLTYGEPKVIKPSEVRSVHDHGTLYDQDQYFQKADFLVRDGEKITLEEAGKHATQSWKKLLIQLREESRQLFTIPLYLEKDLGGNQGLHIVRSIIPGLVPIGFGHMQEPRGMERVITIAKQFGNKSITYRDMPKLPHPFI